VNIPQVTYKLLLFSLIQAEELIEDPSTDNKVFLCNFTQNSWMFLFCYTAVLLNQQVIEYVHGHVAAATCHRTISQKQSISAAEMYSTIRVEWAGDHFSLGLNRSTFDEAQ